MSQNSRFQWIQKLSGRNQVLGAPIDCLNCGTEFTGQFCPQCGQPSKVKRLTIFAVIKDFIDALSDSDRGFLRTVLDLSKAPGPMLRDYIAGKRQRYLSAGKYSFFIIVLFTINISFLEVHYGFFEGLVQQVDGLSTSPPQEIEIKKKEAIKNAKAFEYREKSTPPSSKKNSTNQSSSQDSLKIATNPNETLHLNFNWLGTRVDKEVSYDQAIHFLKIMIPRYHRSLFNNLKFFIVLWIPIFAFFSFFLFFRSPYNFAEHITINAYIYSHILLIISLFSPLYWFLPNLAGTTFSTSLLAAGFYLIYSYFEVFQTGKYRAVKVATSLGFSFMTYFIVLMALASVQAIHFAVENIHHLQ